MGGGEDPKIPNEKLFHSYAWFHRKDSFYEKTYLSQMAIFTPHEDTDGKNSIFTYADVFL